MARIGAGGRTCRWLFLVAFLSAACGLSLDTVTRGRLELKRFHYLAVSLPRRFGEGHQSGMDHS
jgi:hypothetical protein